jgi:hypothetical protein
LDAWSATPYPVEQFHGALLAFAAGPQAAEIHRQDDVFQDRERRHQLEELEHHPGIPTAPFGQSAFRKVMQRFAPRPDLTRRRPVDAGEHIQQRGFTAAGFPDHGPEFPRWDREDDAVQRLQRGSGHRIFLAHTAQPDALGRGGLGRCNGFILHLVRSLIGVYYVG